MTNLTKLEETVLLAIFRLGKDAYGVTIQNKIHEVGKGNLLYSTLYSALDQLVRKNYLDKKPGDPTPQRGGKRKIYFSLTKAGQKALKASFLNHKTVWKGITEESFD